MGKTEENGVSRKGSVIVKEECKCGGRTGGSGEKDYNGVGQERDEGVQKVFHQGSEERERVRGALGGTRERNANGRGRGNARRTRQKQETR